MAEAEGISYDPQTQTIRIERTFDAPRQLVWDVWTQPQHITQWWGPKDFTAPVCEVEFRVGGRYLYGMQDPDGKRYFSTGTFREIVEPEKIVCTDQFADENGNPVNASDIGLPGDWPDELLVTTLFNEVDGRTELTITQVGTPSDIGEDASTGWAQMLEKLADYLEHVG